MKTLQAVVMACLILFVFSLPGWAQQTLREERTFKTAAVPTVSVSDVSGTVKISGDKGSEVRVIAEKTDPKIEIFMEQTGNRVRIEVRHPELSNSNLSRWFGKSDSSGNVNIQITMPETGNLEARSVSGDITVDKLQGDLQVKTVSGDLKLRQLANRITAETVSGDMQIEQMRGEMTLKSVSGDLTAQELEGRLTMSSVSGDMHIRRSNLSFASIEATSGDLGVETPLAPNGSYTLNSHSGDITLSVPKNSSFRISAKTFSGDFHSEFTLPVTAEGQTERHSGRNITAKFGAGDADLRLRTFSGDVRLVAQ